MRKTGLILDIVNSDGGIDVDDNGVAVSLVWD